MPQIKTLPIVERWDCHNCGICCRGSIVYLDDDDLQRLKNQNWDKHPDFQGVQTVATSGWLHKQHRLAQREDGSCVFLTAEGLCRVHQEFGFDEKPLFCRAFPLQIVPLGKSGNLTVRRACPSAAAGKGRKLEEQKNAAVKLQKKLIAASEGVLAPAVTAGRARDWSDAHRAFEAIEKVMTNAQAPLVRRLVQGLQFCDLLDKSKAGRLDSRQLSELIKLLEPLSAEGVSDYFAERTPPGRGARVLFRQAAAEYIRLHPTYRGKNNWRDYLHSARMAIRLVRGRGQAPPLHPGFPLATFEQLEQPLGHLAPEVTQPLAEYFEAAAISKCYAMLDRRGWAIVDSFRALALSYAVGMWLLRWSSIGRTPMRDDVINIVTVLDRGQGYEPLVGKRHRQRTAALARAEELERLAAWYAQ